MKTNLQCKYIHTWNCSISAKEALPLLCEDSITENTGEIYFSTYSNICFRNIKWYLLDQKNDWDLKIKLASSIFRECIKTIGNKNKWIKHSFSEYVLLAGRLSIKYLAIQKEIKDGNKIPKGSFEEHMKKWEPKK